MTNFDIALLALTALMVVSACFRGLNKELLHTTLFAGAMVAGVIFLNQTHPSTGTMPETESTQAAFLTLNLAYYAIAAYLLTSVFMKFVGPLLMKDIREIGIRSRLSAGSLALAKIIFTAVMLNTWYIAHAPEPSPTRLLALPEMLQTSQLLQLSDAGWAQSTAEFLAQQGFLTLPEVLPAEAAESPDDTLITPATSNQP
ncbi:MAG: CvpA family protein [Alphaproteobacteria bacterium]